VVRLVVTGGSLTRKTEKIPSLSPGRGTLTNKRVPKPKLQTRGVGGFFGQGAQNNRACGAAPTNVQLKRGLAQFLVIKSE